MATGTDTGGNSFTIPSVGVQAASPVNNISKPATTLPASQVAPKDLSSIYGKSSNGTIYNIKSQTAFSNPNDFFKDSGLTSFDNVNFSNYTPTGKETVYGQTPTTNPTIAQPSGAPSTPSTPAYKPYTPPNQGTTGVSQGGIIGNLLGFAQNESPEVKQARNDLKNLQSDYGQENADILSRPEGLSQQTGQQGILQNLFATKQSAYQTALQNALTSQGQQIGATQNAGQLNAPIVNPLTGELVAPSSNSTTNSTTSGAPLGSLVGSRSNADVYNIGTRVGADGHTTEYFNKADPSHGFSTPQALVDFINSKNPQSGANSQNVFDFLNTQQYYNKNTNQAFSNPQELATFVNQQNGNNNATAQNVFDLLKNQNSGSGPIQSSDPYFQVLQQAANLLKNNQVDQANSLMANMPALVKAQVYSMVGGNFNYNTAVGGGQAQQTITQQQQQQIAGWKSSEQQADNVSSQFADLIKTWNLNPSELNLGNAAIQKIASNTSDPRYAQFANYMNELAGIYSNILGQGGNTDYQSQLAHSLIDSTAQGTSILQVIQGVKNAAEAKIAGVYTAPTTYNTGGSSGYDAIINQYLK